MLVTRGVEAAVSARRLTKFMLLDEVPPLPPLAGPAGSAKPAGNEAPVVEIRDASFTWAPTKAPPPAKATEAAAAAAAVGPEAAGPARGFALSGITLAVGPADFVCVVGKVASGKTSLLSAVLGEMRRTGGAAAPPSGRVAYVASTAWIQNLTVRESILFGEPLDEGLYTRVLEACQLLPDLEALPDGDATEIGERGITLSGGQKQRVALARAAYHGLRNNASLFLLDDPLSAVDLHVAEQLFERVISSRAGLLRGAAKLLVLNAHYHLLKRADRILVLDGGRVAARGSYEELLASSPLFAELVSASSSASASASAGVAGEDAGGGTGADADADAGGDAGADSGRACVDDVELKELKEEEEEEEHDGSTPASGGDSESTSATSATNDGDDKAKKDTAAKQGGGLRRATTTKLVEAEDREMGAVSASTYKAYYSSASGGHGMVAGLLIVGSFVVAQSVRTLDDVFLALWAESDATDAHWLTMYCAFAGVAFGLYVLSSFVFMAAAVVASRTFHNRIFKAILAAPVNLFFDVTPAGRILNRFARDIDQIDMLLPDYFVQFLQNSCYFLSAAVMCVVANAYFAAVLVPIAAFFFGASRYFRRSIRELKRLEGVSRSPIFSSFAEALDGLGTVRAFRAGPRLLRAHEARVDRHNAIFLCYWISGNWPVAVPQVNT